MPRTATAAAKTAAAAEIVRAVALVFFDFAGAPVRVTSAPWNIEWDSDGDLVEETFTGVGQLGRISPVEEGAEQRAYQIQFTLSGIDPTLISTALTADYQGRDVKLWVALYDNDYALIDDPVLIFNGLMDTMNIEIGAEGTIALIATSRLARWEVPPNHRYNDATQQGLYPGDKGLERVEEMVERVIQWPTGF